MPLRNALLLMLLAVVGCHGKPMRVKMTGDVTTRTPSDNTAHRVCGRCLPAYGNCCGPRIALIDLDGVLVNRNMSGFSSFGENPVAMFREKLAVVAEDPDVRAVVLRINSPGGGVTATDIMRRDLEVFKIRTGLPVVACLMDVGAGGAYYLATAADAIYAHPTTITGGIGCILNIYNLEDALAQQNVVALPIKSGEQIDIGSPVKALTAEAKRVLDTIAGQFHQRFIDAVVAARNINPLRQDNTLFDGRILTAEEALGANLIDQIGYLDDAITAAREMGGLGQASCVALYRRPNDRALTRYDITPNIPMQNSIFPFSIPGLDRSQLPTFLYMWQPEPLLEKTGGV
jgi:protease-4